MLPDGWRVLFGGGGGPGWDAGDAWLFDARTHAWARLALDDAVAAAAAAAAGDLSDVARQYNEAHALQEGGEPPAFAHYTRLHVVAAEDGDAGGGDGAALAVVWGGIAHEPLSAARAAGAALPRMLCNGAMRVMRIERAPVAAATAAKNE